VLLVEDNPADQRLFNLAVKASGVACEVAVAGACLSRDRGAGHSHRAGLAAHSDRWR
jgi:hypothetical protein